VSALATQPAGVRSTCGDGDELAPTMTYDCKACNFATDSALQVLEHIQVRAIAGIDSPECTLLGAASVAPSLVDVLCKA